MGIRATMIGDDLNLNWPQWLFDKHDFLTDEFGMLQTKEEVKAVKYHKEGDVFTDILKAFREIPKEWIQQYKLVVLCETGWIARVIIDIDKGVEYEIHCQECDY